jgi:hypothetical protein
MCGRTALAQIEFDKKPSKWVRRKYRLRRPIPEKDWVLAIMSKEAVTPVREPSVGYVTGTIDGCGFTIWLETEALYQAVRKKLALMGLGAKVVSLAPVLVVGISTEA